LERNKKGRKETKRAREVNTSEPGVLAPAGLPGKATDLASHHTQPASAHV